jgi:hypothetical protein
VVKLKFIIPTVHVTVGAVLSVTVINAVQLETLPDVSVTVIVINTVPTSEQPNVLWLNPQYAIVQLSLLLLLTSFGVVLPLPEPSSVTVTFLHTATGSVVSVTIIVLEHVPVFPLPSVTVAVTVCVPSSVHVNDVMLRTVFVTEQLSPELNTMSVALTVPMPVPSSVTTTDALVHVTTGFIMSLTVTNAVQLETLPALSVTVMVITTDGMSAQVKTL